MIYKLIYSSIVLLSLLFCTVNAQTVSNNASKNVWTNVSFYDNELSVSIPNGFIVDAEKRDYGQVGEIYGFENDVRFVLRVSKESDPKQSITRYFPLEHLEYVSFEKSKFKGLMSSLKVPGAAFENTITIAGKKHVYRITITSPDKTKPEIARFLNSIKLKGENIFVNDKAQKFSDEPVTFENLQTNVEIKEAYSRKFSKEKGQIIFQAYDNVGEVQSYKEFSRPPLVLDQPYPRIRPNNINSKKGSIHIVLKARLLADGQVGNVTVLSKDNKDYAEKCADEARKLVFVPAQINGVSADSEVILNYRMSFQTFSSVTIFPSGLPF